MKNLKRKSLAAAMLVCIALAGAFAQKPDRDRRPPKGDGKVVVEPKQQRPPQNSNNRGDKKNDKKGKP